MDIIKDLKEAKILGHPIHIMLVHFPAALLPVSFAFDMMGVLFGNQDLVMTGFYTLTAGLWLGVLSALFGLIDYFRIPESNKDARRKGVLHMIINIIWMSAFGVLWALKMQAYPDIEPATPAGLIISGILIMMLLFSNHLGGDLVLKHGIGTVRESKPGIKTRRDAL